MLACARCGKVIKECCDIYYPVTDTRTGEDAVICGDCGAEIFDAEELKADE